MVSKAESDMRKTCNSTVTPNNSDNMFCKVMKNRRQTVANWLHSKYPALSNEDAEDIIQESSADLWIWIKNKGFATWDETDYVRLWIAFCKNKCTHWLRKVSKFTQLSDSTLRVVTESSEDSTQLTVRDAFYSYVDKMNNRDNALIQMLIEGQGNDTICKSLGLKNKAVLKNIKCRVLARMKRDLAGNKYSLFIQSA